MEPCLYQGNVTHTRLAPFRHHFVYRVFSMLLDIDGVPQQTAKTRFFSHNRWNILAFFDRDHGARDGSPVRPWIDGVLRANGYDPSGWRVWLHCFPRLFGYVFNPLSIYFCCDAEGQLRALLYDVRNTFGDKHGYLIPVTAAGIGPIEHGCAKGFHVSPFFPLDGRYTFTLTPPGERLAVRITLSDATGPTLIAAQTGKRVALCDRNILKLVLSHPLMTLKVIAAIHWEALWIWKKGAAFHRRPEPPDQEVTAILPVDPPPQQSRASGG
ncbi:DUF1365 domain-containing protein [Elstera cyanobacteriorum]|uniref:DUF1365 domain-containing protein n=1 Tax=Elstera cyanobacteriorum TaxID=2022747 RepID=UPI0023533BA8|nr:DUF1365 domain-containing protein [Elstera cyanobacteriorum]MCK6444049.1 DUF1365 domain-containing protein [Elstera cyanobacteriorum]